MISVHIPPFPAADAVAIALSLVGTGTYELGTGNATTPPGGVSDCAGFAICKCYGLTRHRPGFNAGAWATVSDDLNVDSAIEDATHRQDLFARVIDLPLNHPRPGDLLCYPTIRLPGHPAPWIGHVGIVVAVPLGAIDLAVDAPAWGQLTVVQCAGPNGRTPAILRTPGDVWAHHDRIWPRPQHRSVLLRVIPRGTAPTEDPPAAG